jgi:hypothetical protein
MRAANNFHSMDVGNKIQNVSGGRPRAVMTEGAGK